MTHLSTFQRIFLLFLITCFSGEFILATALPPDESTTQYEHLVEVNQEWTKQQDLSTVEMTECTHFENDIQRIQTHLQLVERTLRQRNTRHLNEEQHTNRNELLEVLNKYWKAGAFPTNLHHANRQPYFVDHKEVHCAVGYLLQQSGETELVQQIKTKDNYAYIHELVKYPELQKWADKYGFTVEELAWIQPGYPPSGQNFEKIGNGGGVVGTVYMMHQSLDNSVLYLAGDFTEVDGQQADNIIAWNGTTWQTLGSGIDGTIYAMEHRENTLVIAGDFTLNGQPCSIAAWSNNTWTPLQTGDMQGAIYALKYHSGRLYIGGDFQMLDGQSMPHIAYLPYGANTTWSNQSNMVFGSTPIPNGFTVNGVVRCFEVIAGQLLVGGYFTETANLTTDSMVNHLTTNYLAYWDGKDWTAGLNGQHDEVHSVLFHNGSLYIGGKHSAQHSISIYTAGVWTYIQGGFITTNDVLIQKFLVHNNEIYAVGDFYFSPFVGYYGNNIVKIEGLSNLSGVANMNNSISTAFSYGDKMFMTGTFDEINNVAGFNGLAASTLISTNTSSIEKEPSTVQIRYGAGQVFVQYESLKENTILQLFNANGQLLENMRLPSGNQMITLETATLSKGMYFYQVQVENRKESGKITLF